MFGRLSPASGESMLTNSLSPMGVSPASPQSATFLPPYLLGSSFSTPSQLQQQQQQHSMFQQQRQANLNSSVAASPFQQRVSWSPNLVQQIPQNNMIHNTSVASATMSRFGGPPLRSLEFDDSLRQQASTFPASMDDSIYSNSSRFQPSFKDSYCIPAEKSGLEEQLDDTVVTVFGFPPEEAEEILREFSTYGTIVNYEFGLKNCNWVHIQYVSSIQAGKALAKNGRLYLHDTVRIGVSPCVEKDVITRFTERKAKNAAGLAQPMSPTPKNASTLDRRPNVPVKSLLFSKVDNCSAAAASPLSFSNLEKSSFISSPAEFRSSSRLGGMRSLTEAYDSGTTPLPPGQLQQSGGGVASKLWRYVFNW